MQVIPWLIQNGLSLYVTKHGYLSLNLRSITQNQKKIALNTSSRFHVIAV